VSARLLRFTIRDLFWLVLAVALAASWWLDRRLMTANQPAGASPRSLNDSSSPRDGNVVEPAE